MENCENMPGRGSSNVTSIRTYSLTVILLVFILMAVSGCVSKEDIRIACLQTLSASTPVCSCNQGTDNVSPEKTVQPAPASQPTSIFPPLSPKPIINGKLIFLADFESGDLSAFRGVEAEYFGKGEFYRHGVVKSPATGNYSASLSIGSGDTTAAYLFVYKVPSTQVGVYSTDFYIPGNTMPGDWWNIWQWKSEDNSFDKPIVHLNMNKQGSRLIASLFYTPGGNGDNESTEITQSKPIPFPTDKWVNITGFYSARSDNTGYVEIYQDGVKIFDVRDIQTKPGNKKVFWSVNSYADRIGPNPATIYVDNLQVYESR